MHTFFYAVVAFVAYFLGGAFMDRMRHNAQRRLQEAFTKGLGETFKAFTDTAGALHAAIGVDNRRRLVMVAEDLAQIADHAATEELDADSVVEMVLDLQAALARELGVPVECEPDAAGPDLTLAGRLVAQGGLSAEVLARLSPADMEAVERELEAQGRLRAAIEAERVRCETAHVEDLRDS